MLHNKRDWPHRYAGPRASGSLCLGRYTRALFTHCELKEFESVVEYGEGSKYVDQGQRDHPVEPGEWIPESLS